MYKYEECTGQYFSELKELIPDIEFLQTAEIDIPDYVILKNSKPIGLIKFTDGNCIEWFEIFTEYRNKHIGKSVIVSILNELKNETKYIRVQPQDKNVEIFWRKCGFIDPPAGYGSMLIYYF